MRNRGDRVRRGMAVLGGVAGLAGLVLASGAFAGPPPGFACVYDSTAKELIVTNEFGGFIFFSLASGDIVINEPDPLPCTGGTPTVNNVDLISVTDTGTAQGTEVGITAPATFQPGATDAGDGLLNPSEIEWDVDLGDAYDVMTYFASGDPGGARVTLGTEGVNHNVSDNELANDLDVEVAGVNAYRFEGGNDDDGVSGAGTQGTGDPLNHPFEYYGLGAGIYGAGGDDYLVGGRRDDWIRGSWGADYIAGGKGTDIADWDDSQAKVTIDIGGENGLDGGTSDNSAHPPYTARDTVATDIENLSGSEFDDILRGDAAANVLTGGLGADKLFGRAGTDLLKAKDLVQDLRLSCGPGADRKARRDPGLDPKPKSC